MLKLKLATLEDIPSVVRLCESLFQESVYASQFQYDPGVVSDQARVMIVAPLTEAAVFVIVDRQSSIQGLLACSHYVPLWCHNSRVGVELAFYVESQSRNFVSYRLLLGAYRRWAKLVGCTHIQMGKIKDKNTIEEYTMRKL